MRVLLCAVPCYIARSPGALHCMSDGYNHVGQVGVVMFFVCAITSGVTRQFD